MTRFARHIFILVGLLIALCNASFLPTKRALTEKVKDGGFEQVPQSDDCLLVHNTKCGGWTAKGSASFWSNTFGGSTPYGKRNGGWFNYYPEETSGVLSQPITGLTQAKYTFSYKYRLFIGYNPGYPCTFTATIGSQTIDKFTIPRLDGGTNDFTSRKKTFTPKAKSGLFALKVVCPNGGDQEDSYSVHIDEISIKGPA